MSIVSILFDSKQCLASKHLIVLPNGAKNGVHAFGYDFAESERNRMKHGALRVHCWGLAPADFRRDPHSCEKVRGSRFFFCPVNNA